MVPQPPYLGRMAYLCGIASGLVFGRSVLASLPVQVKYWERHDMEDAYETLHELALNTPSDKLEDPRYLRHHLMDIVATPGLVYSIHNPGNLVLLPLNLSAARRKEEEFRAGIEKFEISTSAVGSKLGSVGTQIFRQACGNIDGILLNPDLSPKEAILAVRQELVDMAKVATSVQVILPFMPSLRSSISPPATNNRGNPRTAAHFITLF